MNLPDNIYIKDESKNPYGTHKDKRSEYIVKRAKEEGVGKLCLITSGNGGFSLAKYASLEGIKVVSIIDKNLKESIKSKLKEVCSVVEVDLSSQIYKPEEIIALSRERDDEVIWEVTNGFPAAYKDLIKEIKDRRFDYIICPVGSGETFVGLYLGLKEFKFDAKLIGVGVKEYPSFADKLGTPWTPYKEKMEEILKEGHSIIRLTEEEVHKVFNDYQEVCVLEPSSAVVWAGLEKLQIGDDKQVVILNSGRGIVETDSL
ncbi:MAG: PLP-dependent lyase/thiolase [Patescibacteria group bacterium]